MKRNRRISGFTMAELLIVVAIIAVLAGVSFVAVQRHQRDLTRLELDSIAQQIFVASQNHLTMAKNENYLGLDGTDDSYGTKVEDRDDGVYYFAVNKGDAFGKNTLLDQMLPFASIEDMVRLSGCYIICYQPESGLVVDVFYCEGADSIDVEAIKHGGDAERSWRQSHDPMIGWYGGEAAATLKTGTWLEQPRIEVINAERLHVRVTDMNTKNTDAGEVVLQLIITGLTDPKDTEPKQVVLNLKSVGSTLPDSYRFSKTTEGDFDVYDVILDDITAVDDASKSKAFANLGGSLILGQDISIQAVTFNAISLANIARSDEETTNSLFERIEKDGDKLTVCVNNIRHLENLDRQISDLDADYEPDEVKQTTDLNWTEFKTAIGGEKVQIYRADDSKEATAENCFAPVTPDYSLIYDGQGYNVIGIEVKHPEKAGLFGTLNQESTEISNLALIDFASVEATGDNSSAGTLAGAADKATITNVVSYNLRENDKGNATVTATGSAGGLIGQATDCQISKSAAALMVSGGESAGGLIGAASGGKVSGCYSGGHTVTDETTKAVVYSKEDGKYNVTATGATGTAGGLIGAAGNTTIETSYSTCSASGATAGGLVGSSEGNITKSYCTGLVKGTAAAGAFAGSLGKAPSECTYFDIINEYESDAGFETLKAVGSGDAASAEIKPFDATAGDYDTFVGAPEDWQKASPYNGKLMEYYQKDGEVRFNLKTVGGLGAEVQAEVKDEETGSITTPADFVTVHYGDWPAPEIFVLNQK